MSVIANTFIEYSLPSQPTTHCNVPQVVEERQPPVHFQLLCWTNNRKMNTWYFIRCYFTKTHILGTGKVNKIKKKKGFLLRWSFSVALMFQALWMTQLRIKCHSEGYFGSSEKSKCESFLGSTYYKFNSVALLNVYFENLNTLRSCRVTWKYAVFVKWSKAPKRCGWRQLLLSNLQLGLRSGLQYMRVNVRVSRTWCMGAYLFHIFPGMKLEQDYAVCGCLTVNMKTSFYTANLCLSHAACKNPTLAYTSKYTLGSNGDICEFLQGVWN